MPAPAQHDLTRTSLGSLLGQRFYDQALEFPGVAGSGGWTENYIEPAHQVEAMMELVEEGWTVARTGSPAFRSWLASSNDGAVYAYIDQGGRWDVLVSAPSQIDADEMLAEIRGFFPEMDYTSDETIVVRFWTLGPMGPIQYYRSLDAAPWSAVEANYPPVVREQLSALMAMESPSAGGRLVLLHGPPGTGKTHAIRALARSLAPWCSLDYVIDVDAFFQHASYMVSTMVMEEGPLDSDRWRVVVLEDSGEYLRPDASDKVGLGLGRLLNLADGLVGQGLRIMILMTTNEHVDELHPAVTRPGRCLANLGLGPFSVEEGEAWLEDHGVTAALDAPATLAELYARLVSPASAVAAGGQLLRWSANPQERTHARRTA